MEELEVIEILSTAYDGDEFPGYENIHSRQECVRQGLMSRSFRIRLVTKIFLLPLTFIPM